MNAIEQARLAYTPVNSPIRTDRSTEYQILSSVTSRLRAATDPTKAGFGRLAQALHENRQLWTRLAVDVASDGNGLPQALRAQIFYLAEFTALHSSKVLRGQASIDALIDINTAMMRGLSASQAVAGHA